MVTATLNDLISLNDEIAALVRAGVPLEQGLADLGGDMPGRLGQIAAALAERTARGESLDQAMLDQAATLPPAYRAVVRAGVRAGRLSAALEAVAHAARRISETQRTAVAAVMYPMAVFSLVWIGLALFSVGLAPHLASSFHSLNVPGQGVFDTLAWAGQWAALWGTIVPVLVLLLLGLWWYACTRASLLYAPWLGWMFNWLPWMGRMMRCTQTATFLEILAMLVENQTPLDEAVALALDASGTAGDCPNFCDGKNGTVPLDGPRANPPALPPMMRWLILTAGRDGALLPALQHTAVTYHRRARHESDLVLMFLPAVLTLVIGGSVTAAYAFMVFIPYIMLLKSLS